MSTQIRVTLDEEIYKQLIKLAKDETRSISNQASVIIKNYFTNSSTPLPTTGYAVSLTPTPTPTPTPTQPTSTPITQPTPITPTQQLAPSLTLTEPDNEYYKKIKKRLSHHVWREFSTVAGTAHSSSPPRHKKIYAYTAPRRH